MINNAYVNCNSGCHSPSSQDSIVFCDVIKDFIYGGRWSSVENTNRELADHVLMHKDFLKPLQQPQSRDGTYVAGIGRKLRMSMGNESPRIQDKLIEASNCHGNARELLRSSCEVSSGSLFPALLHTRRFSYDGQDIPRTSSVSRETSKSVMKLKEFPRLSLYSMECSMRSSNYNSKTNRILEDLKQSSIERSFQQWGLKYEVLELSEGGSPRRIKESRQNQSPQSQRSSSKGHVSPRRRNSEVTKPILSSTSQIETARSRQRDRSCSPRRTAFRIQDMHWFEELEFQQSSRDQRALKHILKATEVKGSIDTKGAEASDHVSHKNYDSHNKDNFDQSPNSENMQNSKNYRLIASPPRRTNEESDFQPPKVIRRPELIEKSSISTSSVMPFNRSSNRNKFRIINSVDRKNVSLNNQTHEGPISKFAIRESGSRILSPVDKKTNGWNESYRSQKPRLRSIQDSPGLKHQLEEMLEA
ncbi:protein LONGIFOLIA 1-like protein [Cinnamomum micranthum f. kanehirae]|uniref:Protein LONGIFOLIA 1-like protein n=1 Tax=Cinnamomum micranthum f. kanehirae TaxID=337451 RepID=A0A3S3MGV9_9MAGN|nr:protein LONGIFOLIA 1-like protein [Cinnamomum micranthum f. kanehirae]